MNDRTPAKKIEDDEDPDRYLRILNILGGRYSADPLDRQSRQITIHKVEPMPDDKTFKVTFSDDIVDAEPERKELE